MGKWTQGPWRAEASDYEGCLQIISADRKRPITEIWGDGDDDEANARLIAAAPELAEALKEARPCVEEIADQVDCTAPHKAVSIYALLARIDALLAKANGGGNG